MSTTQLVGAASIGFLIVAILVLAWKSPAEKMQPWQHTNLQQPKHQIMMGVTPNAMSRELYQKKPMRAALLDPFEDKIQNIHLDNPYLGCNRAPAGPLDVTQDPTQILTMQEQSIEDEEYKTS